ncbi:MAG: hypothetical protein GQ533_06890 [Methanosarcinaceae archaeon]|nr:hypothetical protein [Methanosarcinaceae archaeon]
MNMIRDINIRNEIKHIITGSVVLVLSWTLVSLVHEFFHSLTAAMLGYQISFNEIALNSGSTIVTGEMLPSHTALVAISGFIGLTTFGLALIYLSEHQSLHMAGVIFLSRAWIDSLPLYEMDGALLAQSSTPILAWTLLLLEITVSGSAIMHVIKGNPEKKIRP